MNKFELHCHSYYSKGKKIPWEGIPSPKEIIRHAKKIGLAGIAITDHNTSAGWKEAKAEAKKLGIVFIPGIEISSEKGHIIGLGLNKPVATGLSVDETIEKIREQGGIAIAAHPFDGEGFGIRNEMAKADAVEVFNAFDIDRVGNFITGGRAEKLGLKKVVGSDAHTIEMLGSSFIKTNASDMDYVLKSIKNGSLGLEKKYIEEWKMVKWVEERVKRSYGDIIKYIDANYSKPKAAVAKFMLGFFMKNPESIGWRGVLRLGVNIYFFKLVLNPRTYL